MKHPWMPIFWGDFFANTLHLTPQEIGAYLLLIAHAWEHGGWVPFDGAQRIARVDNRHWRKVLDRLLPFFQIDQATEALPRRLVHGRVLRELAKADEISWKRKAAALQMHSNRMSKCTDFAHANHDAKRLQNGGNYQASREPLERSQSVVPVDNGDNPNANPAHDQAPSQSPQTQNPAADPPQNRRDIQEALNLALAKLPTDRTLDEINLILGWAK